MKKKLSTGLAVLLMISAIVGCTGAPQEASSATPAPATSPSVASTPPVSADVGTEITKPEGYPDRTIELIVPAAAGAIIDVPSRALADSLDLGQPVVVVNLPGASQTTGTAQAAAKPADGYTLLTGANGGILLQPHLIDLTYSMDDFRHISMIMSPDPMVVVAAADSEIKSFSDLEAALKGGQELTFSGANPGSIGHLALLALMDQMGVSAEFVPFNGSAEGITALLGGHIDFYVVDATEASKRVQEKQFNPLIVLSDEALSTMPDTPTSGSIGYPGLSNFMGYKWIAVHKDTPDEIVNWIKQEIDATLQTPTYQDYLKNAHSTPLRVYTEEEITKILKESTEACGAQFKALGMAKS